MAEQPPALVTDAGLFNAMRKQRDRWLARTQEAEARIAELEAAINDLKRMDLGGTAYPFHQALAALYALAPKDGES